MNLRKKEKAMKKGEIVLFQLEAQIMNLIFNLRPNQDSHVTDSSIKYTKTRLIFNLHILISY